MTTQFYPYDKIVEKYPYLYKEVKFIECNAGWFKLIDELSEELEKLIIKFIQEDSEPDSFGHPCASQVKEKYGTLRFYMITETDEMSKLIETAEKKSAEICEYCGKKGEIIKASWLTCLCKKCREKK